MKIKIYILALVASLGILQHCTPKEETLFEKLEANATGIDFVNVVQNTEDFNIFNYRNFYNGGGVAVGDINNDGLPDIYFTANMGENKLYLNKGNMTFEDITDKAGVAEALKWSTGVVMVDINHDNLLDIYVCNAGYQINKGQENALFINNGDLTFTNKAAEYGLDDNGYSTHAAFFDYDLDGDLDMYSLNNSFIPVNTLNYANNRDLRAEDWPVKDFLKGGGDKLFRNDNGKFVDVSKETGIYGSLIGFGLGVTVGDVNNDNYPDIYISNDFFERDYLYINQKNGTFKEDLESRMTHTSFSSMGADMADINNDGHPEIFVTDMLARDEERLKTTTSFDNHYVYELKREKGFYHQLMQNTLQLNNQDGTFTDVAYLGNVAASDWSWGALLFDADNDKNTDIFVCNGIYHDVIDQDFIDFFANDVNQKMVLSGEKAKFDNIINNMPSRPIANLFFKNKGQLSFDEVGKEMGLDDETFSNGAAYADLDNDGDLDLVVNNLNQPCGIYKNKANEKKERNKYLKIQLKGDSTNTFAIGAKVHVFIGNEILSKQLHPARGFQSSTEYPMTFGVGQAEKVDSIQIIWPNRQYTTYRNIQTDSTYSWKQHAGPIYPESINLVTSLFQTSTLELPKHQENEHIDYYNEKNIPIMLSKEGPKVAVGDINNDGKHDLYVCGAAGQAGQLLIQHANGTFLPTNERLFGVYTDFEDTAALFFDMDKDGDLDLYVGSGGNTAPTNDRLLNDRLYENDGKGNFTAVSRKLPPNGYNTSVVRAADFDQDGDLDLFVGSRNTSMQYGVTPESYLFVNDGKGNFTNKTEQIAPDLQRIGMVRDAQWTQLVGDKKPELVVVGDWMAPQIFTFDGKKLNPTSSELAEMYGFWGSVLAEDINQDGFTDLILGNIGENFTLRTDQENPLKIWVADFDGNSIVDKVITKSIQGEDVPVFLKREMMEQFPFLKTQNLKHSEYAKRTIQDLFKSSILDKAEQRKVNFLASGIAYNQGNGTFKFEKLPIQAQFSCMNAIQVLDINGDAKKDLVYGGNYTHFIPQFGRLDGNRGGAFIQDKQNKWTWLSPQKSGIQWTGEIRDIQKITIGTTPTLLFVRNNDTPISFIPTIKK